MLPNSNKVMQQYRAQAVKNILAGKEARRARMLLASASNHLVATKVAYAAANKAVDLQLTVSSKHLELWLKKLPSQIQEQPIIPVRTL